MDKRYKFVRGERFAGLEDYWDSKEIEVKNKELIYVIKKKPPSNENSNSTHSFKKKLGCFYEILIQGIYGGERNKKLKVKNDRGFSFEIIPDLVLGEMCWESKGVASEQNLRLTDNQMAKYALLQKAKLESKTPIIKTETFRHGINNLESRFTGKPLEDAIKDLVFQLTQKTKYLISIDLSIIFEYYRLSKRYDKGKSFTRINKGDLNTLLAYPEESLEKIGINLKDIVIKKKKFPSGVTMDNHEISSFPVLIIENTNYPEDWLEYFNEVINDKEKVPELFFDEFWSAEAVESDEEKEVPF